MKAVLAARFVLFAFVLAALFGAHKPAASQTSQTISSLDLEISGDDSARLRAQIDFALSTRLKEILRNDQPIEFVFEVRFYVKRPYWLDLEYATVGWRAHLAYDNVLDAYKVVAFNGGESTAKSIEEAMAALGDVHGLEVNADRLGDRLKLSGGRMQTRFEVNLAQLPAPLRIDLLSRLDWDFSTGWQEWRSAELVRGGS